MCRRPGSRLPGEVFDLLAGVDMVMHAGDMHIIDVLDWLEVIAPVVGARGNGDGDGFRPPFPDDDPRVEHAQVLELDGASVGLIHGFPLPDETPWVTTETLMDPLFWTRRRCDRVWGLAHRPCGADGWGRAHRQSGQPCPAGQYPRAGDGWDSYY